MEIGREEGKERGTLWVLEKEKLERKGGRKEKQEQPEGRGGCKGIRREG